MIRSLEADKNHTTGIDLETIRSSEANIKKQCVNLWRRSISEPGYRVKHNKKCVANRRGRLSRQALSKNLTLQHALRIRRKYKRNVGFHLETPGPLMTDEMKAAIQNFYKNIQNGPTYVCTVCHRALFPNQVKHCKRDKYTKNMRVVADCLTGKYVHVCGSACSTPCSVPQERMGEWICYTCDSHLTRGKMPSIAAVNNLHLASVPPELAELNVLERQLIAKILPFAKIVSLPKGQQRAIHGAVVCVPSDMETVVNSSEATWGSPAFTGEAEEKNQVQRVPILLHSQHEKCLSCTDKA